MKKKIQKQFMVISTLAIVAMLFLSSILCYDLFRAQVFEELRTYAHVVLHAEDNDIAQIEKIIREYRGEGSSDIRMTLIDASGKVLADNHADAAAMSNHNDRKEVKDAWETGEGMTVRNSNTIQRASYYVAIRIDDQLVLRVSKDSSSIYDIFMKAIPIVVVVVVVLWVWCMSLSKVLTESILRPIKDMSENLDKEYDARQYEELQPFLETIRKQHEDILQSARMRQEFTANVSHELKTPLTSISGYSELIEAGMVSEKDVQRFATEIHKNANRLLSLINDTIELSELDALNEIRDVEEVDLYDLALTSADMLELNASKRKVTIEVEGESAFVSGSRKMLEEVVYNLCDNGIRYNVEHGKVIMRVLDKGDSVVFQVTDTGIGIPREHQGRVFERFYRVDKSRSKSTGGTGLGLAIVKHIAAIHGAAIELKSEENMGTMITLTFLKNSSKIK